MATTPQRTSTTSAAGGKKAKQQRGPQKRTFHFFIKVVDGAGNVIPGASLKVERIITDARKVIEFMDTPDFASLGLTRIKYETTAEPRDSGDDTSNGGTST